MSDLEIPITVISAAEAETVDMVVCMRVSDARLVVPHSREAVCAICGAAVWVSPSSPTRPPKWCLPCVTASLKEQQ